jgi:hypothetical protein
MFDAAFALLLLVPKEHKPPGGDGGGHVLRDVYEVPMPGDNSFIFNALEYDGEGIGANALCQSATDIFSDQPKYAIENVPVEDWVGLGLE